MSIVAGAAIVSQLLPMGTVIANAQTNGTVNTQSENQTAKFENDIQIFDMDGNKGFKITVDSTNNKLHTDFLPGYNDKDKATFSNYGDKYYNEECVNITIYDVYNNEKKERPVLKTFTYKGSDPISKAVNQLNGQKFKCGYGIRIVHRSENKSCVKVSGYVRNEASWLDKGVKRRIMDSIVFVNQGNWFEKQQDRNWETNDYSEYLK